MDMDTDAPRFGRSTPVPVGTGRTAGIPGHQQAPKEDSPASQSAVRRLRDVLADLMQCDPKG